MVALTPHDHARLAARFGRGYIGHAVMDLIQNQDQSLVIQHIGNEPKPPQSEDRQSWSDYLFALFKSGADNMSQFADLITNLDWQQLVMHHPPKHVMDLYEAIKDVLNAGRSQIEQAIHNVVGYLRPFFEYLKRTLSSESASLLSNVMDDTIYFLGPAVRRLSGVIAQMWDYALRYFHVVADGLKRILRCFVDKLNVAMVSASAAIGDVIQFMLSAPVRVSEPIKRTLTESMMFLAIACSETVETTALAGALAQEKFVALFSILKTQLQQVYSIFESLQATLAPVMGLVLAPARTGATHLAQFFKWYLGDAVAAAAKNPILIAVSTLIRWVVFVTLAVLNVSSSLMAGLTQVVAYTVGEILDRVRDAIAEQLQVGNAPDRMLREKAAVARELLRDPQVLPTTKDRLQTSLAQVEDFLSFISGKRLDSAVKNVANRARAGWQFSTRGARLMTKHYFGDSDETMFAECDALFELKYGMSSMDFAHAIERFDSLLTLDINEGAQQKLGKVKTDAHIGGSLLDPSNWIRVLLGKKEFWSEADIDKLRQLRVAAGDRVNTPSTISGVNAEIESLTAVLKAQLEYLDFEVLVSGVKFESASGTQAWKAYSHGQVQVTQYDLRTTQDELEQLKRLNNTDQAIQMYETVRRDMIDNRKRVLLHLVALTVLTLFVVFVVEMYQESKRAHQENVVKLRSMFKGTMAEPVGNKLLTDFKIAFEDKRYAWGDPYRHVVIDKMEEKYVTPVSFQQYNVKVMDHWMNRYSNAIHQEATSTPEQVTQRNTEVTRFVKDLWKEWSSSFLMFDAGVPVVKEMPLYPELLKKAYENMNRDTGTTVDVVVPGTLYNSIQKVAVSSTATDVAKTMMDALHMHVLIVNHAIEEREPGVIYSAFANSVALITPYYRKATLKADTAAEVLTMAREGMMHGNTNKLLVSGKSAESIAVAIFGASVLFVANLGALVTLILDVIMGVSREEFASTTSTYDAATFWLAQTTKFVLPLAQLVMANSETVGSARNAEMWGWIGNIGGLLMLFFPFGGLLKLMVWLGNRLGQKATSLPGAVRTSAAKTDEKLKAVPMETANSTTLRKRAPRVSDDEYVVTTDDLFGSD